METSSDRERELLGGGTRLESARAAVGDVEALLERRHHALHRLRRRAVRVRTAIEGEIARHQLRPVAREVLQEVLARAGLQIEDVAPDVGGPGVTRGLDDIRERSEEHTSELQSRENLV